MKCTIQQISYPSKNKYHDIRAYLYQPYKSKPKAIIQIVHGMCEYFLRYDDFARFLTDAGFLVCGNDHVGHGNSIRRYDDYGYFAPKDGDEILCEDVHELTKIMKARYPDLPIILFGHSMGSFITRLVMENYPNDYEGIILSGTSGKNPALKAGLLVAEITESLRGGHYRSAFIKKLASTKGNFKPAYNPECDWLTRDHAIVDKAAADRKMQFIFTVRGYHDLFTLMQRMSRKDWCKNIRKDLPVYLMSGEDDTVGNYGKGVREVYKHLKKIGMQDVAIKLYPHGRHEMLNEINRNEVYADVLRIIHMMVDHEKLEDH